MPARHKGHEWVSEWFNTDFHFSRKRSTLPDHQRWWAIDCIHGDSTSQPVYLALFVSFYHPLREVSNIILVINSCVVFVLGTTDGHMMVCCKPTNGDIFTFQQFCAPSFSIALDDVTSEICYYIPRVVIHQCVVAMFGAVSWTITTAITIKIDNCLPFKLFNLASTFILPCLINNRNQVLLFCIVTRRSKIVSRSPAKSVEYLLCATVLKIAFGICTC